MAYYRNAMIILEWNVLQSFKKRKLGKVQSQLNFSKFEMSLGLTSSTESICFNESWQKLIYRFVFDDYNLCDTK